MNSQEQNPVTAHDRGIALAFTLIGKPVPAGSKRAFPLRRKDGTLGVLVSDASGQRLKAWKQQIREAALQAAETQLGLDVQAILSGGGPLPHLGPVLLHIEFRVCRPRIHFRASGELKPRAPDFPLTRPDLTKLLRGIEDALTGLIWKDDSQICRQVIEKSYLNSRGGIDTTVIAIRLLP